MRPRKTQKPRREDALGKENADLKKQIGILKRQVAKLKKELLRLELLTPEEDDRDGEALPVTKTKPNTPQQRVCPNCGASDIIVLNLPSGAKISICKGCRNVIR